MIRFLLYFPVLVFLLLLSCKENRPIINPTYKNITPEYDLVQLHLTADTLHFPLDADTYNAIKSFNFFQDGNTDFISFYDQRSQSINIYHFQSQSLVKKLQLKDYFRKHRIYKATVYVKNFDSIFICNNKILYLSDSAGVVKKSIDLLQKSNLTSVVFENSAPPVVRGNYLYAALSPGVKETSLKELGNWKVLYEFDLLNDKVRPDYHLPGILRENLFGRRFFECSYCYNDRGNFVFSFPADSCIYETNLSGYHIAYNGKSRHQTSALQPVSRKDLLNDEGFKNYLLRDSYGEIFFDSNKKRYLRVAKSKMTEKDYLVKMKRKKQRIIISNEQFKIVGESAIDDQVYLNTLFITSKGEIYARTNVGDEYALHFVRLAYKDKPDAPVRLAKK